MVQNHASWLDRKTVFYNLTFSCNTTDFVGFYQRVVCDLMETLHAKDNDVVLRTLVESDECLRSLAQVPPTFAGLSDYMTNDNSAKAMKDPLKVQKSTVRISHNASPQDLIKGTWMDHHVDGITIKEKDL